MISTYLDYWILGQMALEGVLVVLVLIFLARVKAMQQAMTIRSGQPPRTPDPTTAVPERNVALQESGKLEQLLNQLTQRSLALQQKLEQMDDRGGEAARVPPCEERGASLRSRVEHLFRHGLEPEEIARRLGMNLAEVKVALDLARLV
ncbi:MAG: hypothetical protein ABIN58_10130 [candidate division WOR-3 bacterium]